MAVAHEAPKTAMNNAEAAAARNDRLACCGIRVSVKAGACAGRTRECCAPWHVRSKCAGARSDRQKKRVSVAAHAPAGWTGSEPAVQQPVLDRRAGRIEFERRIIRL